MKNLKLEKLQIENLKEKINSNKYRILEFVSNVQKNLESCLYKKYFETKEEARSFFNKNKNKFSEEKILNNSEILKELNNSNIIKFQN